MPACEATFRTWHKCVRAMMQAIEGTENDTAAESHFELFVNDHVADDVMLAPPTYFATYTGKGPFAVILTSVAKVFGTTFTYHRQWLSADGREWALEFTSDNIGGTKKSVRGIDLVSLDARGRIVSFRILAGA